jgi:hypothetical protein
MNFYGKQRFLSPHTDFFVSLISQPRGGGMAQVVENLPCKHTALSSNPMMKKKSQSVEGRNGKNCRIFSHIFRPDLL